MKGSRTNSQVVAGSVNLCWSSLDMYRGRFATGNYWHPPFASTPHRVTGIRYWRFSGALRSITGQKNSWCRSRRERWTGAPSPLMISRVSRRSLFALPRHSIFSWNGNLEIVKTFRSTQMIPRQGSGTSRRVCESGPARGLYRPKREWRLASQQPKPCCCVSRRATQGKTWGKVTARVLFDGTHGINVNSRIRLRDQERAPIAADLKRTMREKAKLDELTFALTADITEAHRQVPIHPDDWHHFGCQGWRRSVYKHCRGPLASRRRPIAGLGLRRLSVGWLNTWWRVQPRRGTCWWPTTISLSAVVPHTAGACLLSSCPEEIRLCWQASSFYCGQGASAYPRGERSGSFVGLR